MNEAETALRAVLKVIQDYLPPGGGTEGEALNKIIALVDPWPLASASAQVAPVGAVSLELMREASAVGYQVAIKTIDADAVNIAMRDFLNAALASAQAAPVGASDPNFAGLLFDFGGFLTTHKVRWKFSAYDDASPMVYAIEEFAALRGLPLEPCNVKDWRTASTPPPQPPAAAEVVAYMTVNDEGDPAMLFFDQQEASSYCNLDEEPIELVVRPKNRAILAASRTTPTPTGEKA